MQRSLGYRAEELLRIAALPFSFDTSFRLVPRQPGKGLDSHEFRPVEYHRAIRNWLFIVRRPNGTRRFVLRRLRRTARRDRSNCGIPPADGARPVADR